MFHSDKDPNDNAVASGAVPGNGRSQALSVMTLSKQISPASPSTSRAEPLIKHIPSDFLVRENCIVSQSTVADGKQHYLLMRKQGYTTMEAVRLIADQIRLLSTEVTYSGLKDEDGITEQLIALPRGCVPADVYFDSGWRIKDETGRWLVLQHYSFGHAPLRIGELEGNSFYITVRNLTAEVAALVAKKRETALLFLNYYDTQRFGVPGGPKRTHHVGSAILRGSWDDALRELVGLRAPESELAAQWAGGAKQFFDQLDPRTVAFYLAATASADWNHELGELITETCPGNYFSTAVNGIQYRYLYSTSHVAEVLARAASLRCTKYQYHNGVISTGVSERAAVVQAMIHASMPEVDPLIDGKYLARLRFSLPSGTYATAAIRQLFAFPEFSGSGGYCARSLKGGNRCHL